MQDEREINIKGLDRAAVLVALYNDAHVQGLGVFHFTPSPLTIVEANQYLKQSTYFDYLNGRVMKVELGGDILHTGLYDRDNGLGAAKRALQKAGLIS